MNELKWVAKCQNIFEIILQIRKLKSNENPNTIELAFFDVDVDIVVVVVVYLN